MDAKLLSLAAVLAFACSAANAADTWKETEGRVHVTGKLLRLNGHTEVPIGLFGVHAIKLTPELIEDWGIECFRQIHFVPVARPVIPTQKPNLKGLKMVIDCLGDRYYPAVCLTNPNYKDYFVKLGREIARKYKDAGWRGQVEFWNEPYLNWAERSRRNYDTRFFDVSKATEGGPVTIKGWKEPLRHLRWRRLWARGEPNPKAKKPQDRAGRIFWGVQVPKGLKPGDTFRSRSPRGWYWTDRREQTFTVAEQWHVYDPTQVSWWSGKQNLEFYLWMFLPFARAVKETNPEVQVIGGWGFHIKMHGWDAWRSLFKPTIDASIQWLDGVDEHHYGGDTRFVAAEYEVVVAYTVTEHNKWIHCYNTETAGRVEAAMPGSQHFQGPKDPLRAAAGALTYGLRDIIYMVYHCPDKAASRTAHGSLTPGWGGGGDEFVFRLLKDLRGRLVQASSNDRAIWPVASVSRSNLVVVVFNDHRERRQVPLRIDAPPGTELQGGRKVWVEVDAKERKLRLAEERLAASGRSYTTKLDLAGRHAVKFLFPLKGEPPPEPQVGRRQFFARGILQQVVPGKPLGLTVVVDETILPKARAARLKLVLEGVRGGEGRARLNGTLVRLPDADWIVEVPIDPKLLKPENKIIFEAVGANANGYQVDMTSLVIDAEAN